MVSTTTNVSGEYIFTGVEPGFYVIIETTPMFYSNISDYDHSITSEDMDGDDSADGPDLDIPVLLLPAEEDADNDFVNGRPGTICGYVRDDTGLPLAGVELNLYLDVNNNDSLDVADIEVATTYTDGDSGAYCFEDLPPDEYIVFEVQPANYNSVSDYDESIDGSDMDGAASADDPDNEIPVTLMPAESDMDNNFVEDPFLGTISGTVTDDSNAPIVSVEIQLFEDTNADGNADGVAISTTFTNSSGDYTFTGLEPGYYVVIEITPLYYSSLSDYDHSTAPPDLDGYGASR